MQTQGKLCLRSPCNLAQKLKKREREREIQIKWIGVGQGSDNVDVLNGGTMGFLSGSDDKESAYNAGDQVSIPVFRISPGEGNGKPLQYCRPILYHLSH